MYLCVTLETGTSREGQGMGLFTRSLVSFLAFLTIISEINVFDISFVSLIYLKVINNCDYLLCSFCFMKMKTHTNVLFHHDWMEMYLLDPEGSTAQVPLCQSNPKRKTDQRWLFWSFCKVHFQRLLENFVLHGNAPWTEKMLWKCRVQTTLVVLLEKKRGWGRIHHTWLYWTWNFLFGKLFVCIKNSCDVPYVSAVRIVEKDLIRLICNSFTNCDQMYCFHSHIGSMVEDKSLDNMDLRSLSTE